APPVTPPGGPLPPLITASRRPQSQTQMQLPKSAPQPTPPPRGEEDLPLAIEDTSQIKLKSIKSVVPVSQLTGANGAPLKLSAHDFVAEVVRAAQDNCVPQMPGDFARLPDGRWMAQFPSTVVAAAAERRSRPHARSAAGGGGGRPQATPRGEGLRGTRGGRARREVTPRKPAPVGRWGSLSRKRPARIEGAVRVPRPGRAVGEMT